MQSTRKFDLNCDMGEGMKNDKLIMPFITSANIACGEHAGDDVTMLETILLAIGNGVKIGAHPGYADRKNFGRMEMELPEEELYQLVYRQVLKIKTIADDAGGVLNHVKPHGALYNAAAKNPVIARIVASVVKDINVNLVVTGLSGSHMITEAQKKGLQTLSEVFGDRTYQDDGSLTPRNMSHAVIENRDKVLKQVMQVVNDNSVTTISGKVIFVKADTICIHGDGKNALDFVQSIHDLIREV